jgi:hypothetical protein
MPSNLAVATHARSASSPVLREKRREKISALFRAPRRLIQAFACSGIIWIAGQHLAKDAHCIGIVSTPTRLLSQAHQPARVHTK